MGSLRVEVQREGLLLGRPAHQPALPGTALKGEPRASIVVPRTAGIGAFLPLIALPANAQNCPRLWENAR
jgi:hypothetical protein